MWKEAFRREGETVILESVVGGETTSRAEFGREKAVWILKFQDINQTELVVEGAWK